MPTVTGSVTLANIRLSLVDGTAFVDFSSATKLLQYLGYGALLTLTDSASKTAIGYVKAAGTGETLGSELVDGWTNSGSYPYETFTSSGSDITSAINTSGTGLCYKAATATTGALYKLVMTFTLNSGTAPSFYWGAGATFGTPRILFSAAVSTGSYYRAASAAHAYAGYFTTEGDATNYAVSGFSLKQVLTPSATGVTIVSAAGGSTQNWTSVDAAFNYNDASAYTYSITYNFPMPGESPMIPSMPGSGRGLVNL